MKTNSSRRKKIQPSPSQPRLLVVDDTEVFTKVVEDLLADKGFVVISAHSGKEALEKILSDNPDVILLDLFMPGMSGFDVLRVLRIDPAYKSFQSIPVLVTSGIYKTPVEIERVKNLGAKGFINKEAIPDFLAYRLKLLLESEKKARVEEVSINEA